MINFDPDALIYKELNTSTDDFKKLLPQALEVETVAKGGIKLDPYKFLLIRDDEDNEITEKRIEKFVDHNYLGSAIRLQRTYQNSGVLQIETDTLPSKDRKPWQQFLDSCSKKEQNLKDFILDVFESALINKICYVQIELPRQPPGVKLNQAQLEKNPELQSIPYLFIVPLQTLMSEELEGNKIKWLKYKRVVKINDPFKGSLYNFEYVYIDDLYTITWTYQNVLLKEDCIDISKIWDQRLNNGLGGYRTINEKDKPNNIEIIEHKRGFCPIVRFEIPDTLYMTEQVYRSQVLIYGLCMNLLHTSANSGFVQKVLQPWIQGSGNSSSGGASYVPLPKEAVQNILEMYAKYMGDESLLLANKFSFEELTGTSIEVQLKIIHWLRDYIFSSIQYSYNSYQNENDAIDSQSGESKIVDYSIRTLALKNHGSKIVQLTRLILQHTARAFNIKNQKALNKIEVSGMDSFDLRPVEEALNLVERLFKLPVQALPKDLLIEALTQLSRVIIQNNTSEYKNYLNGVIIDSVEKYIKSLESDVNQSVKGS